MSTIWIVIVAWLAFDAGVLAGCVWKASREEIERETWARMCSRYHALLDESFERERKSLRLLTRVTQETEPEGFAWKAGTGVE